MVWGEWADGSLLLPVGLGPEVREEQAPPQMADGQSEGKHPEGSEVLPHASAAVGHNASVFHKSKGSELAKLL